MAAKRDDDFFWQGVDCGELLAQECAGCGRLRHPPSPRCGECGSPDWTSRRLKGAGKIHSWLVSRHPTRPDADPRLLILVDLEEGLRLISNLIDVENAEIGAEVALEFAEVNGQQLPLFRTSRTTSD